MFRSNRAINRPSMVTANPPQKTLKRASTLEIEAYKRSVLSITIMRRAHHMYMRMSHVRMHYRHALTCVTYTYHVDAHYAWARMFRTQTWT